MIGLNPAGLIPIRHINLPRYNIHVYPTKLRSHQYSCSLCRRNITRMNFEFRPLKWCYPCQRCLDMEETNIRNVEKYERVNCGLAGEGGLLPNINLDNEIEKEEIKKEKIRVRKNEKHTELLDKLTREGKTETEIEVKLKTSDDRRILKCVERVEHLEHAKELREGLSLAREIVSDDVRRYGDETTSVIGHIIETHCTIFRTVGSHRNTYFGHVSLHSKKFINGIENENIRRTWHYGVEVPYGAIEPLNPRHPLRSFWPQNSTYILITDLCIDCAPNCEASRGFPAGTYISNLLLEHFTTCITTFNTGQWPDQEWGH